MQIREMTLKELYTVYDVVKQHYSALDYDTFEDLIYDMRDIKYTMLGIFEKESLACYAGVSVQTNLCYGRHLLVFELITDKAYRKQGYAKMMLEYLEDYVKMAQCEKIVFAYCKQGKE